MQPDIAEIARGLSEIQRGKVRYPVSGVISGLYCVSSEPETLRRLHLAGIVNEPFEPTDFATRGYAHAARLNRLGLAVRSHLLSKDKIDGDR